MNSILEGLVETKRLKLFLTLSKNPEKIYSLTELSKQTKLSITTILRLTQIFTKNHILEQIIVGKIKLYKLAQNKKTCITCFIVIAILGFIFGSILMPVTRNFRHTNSSMPDTFVIGLSISILLILGFILTFVTEGYVVARKFGKSKSKIISTVLIMNIISYSALLISSGMNIYKTIFKT